MKIDIELAEILLIEVSNYDIKTKSFPKLMTLDYR